MASQPKVSLLLRGQSRLAIAMGLGLTTTAVLSAYVGLQIESYPGLWATTVRTLLSAALLSACVLGAYTVADRNRAVFGYLSLVYASWTCVVAFAGLVASWRRVALETTVSTWAAPLVAGLAMVGVTVVVAIALAARERPQCELPTREGVTNAGDRWLRGRVATALGLSPSLEPAALQLTLWAVGFTTATIILSVVLTGYGLISVGAQGLTARLVEVVVLPLLVFVAIRWGRAPASLWVPTMTLLLVVSVLALVNSVLGVVYPQVALPADLGPAAIRLHAVLLSNLLGAALELLIVAATIALVLGAVVLATRSRARDS